MKKTALKQVKSVGDSASYEDFNRKQRNHIFSSKMQDENEKETLELNDGYEYTMYTPKPRCTNDGNIDVISDTLNLHNRGDLKKKLPFLLEDLKKEPIMPAIKAPTPKGTIVPKGRHVNTDYRIDHQNAASGEINVSYQGPVQNPGGSVIRTKLKSNTYATVMIDRNALHFEIHKGNVFHEYVNTGLEQSFEYRVKNKQTPVRYQIRVTKK